MDDQLDIRGARGVTCWICGIVFVSHIGLLEWFTVAPRCGANIPLTPLHRQDSTSVILWTQPQSSSSNTATATNIKKNFEQNMREVQIGKNTGKAKK